MRRKIIWLCSWYPNDTDLHTGDFIQRQALAAAQEVDLEVVHVADAGEDRCTVTQAHPHLRETIYYNKAVGKIFRYKDFFQLHESFLSDYIKRKGKPDLIHVHIPLRSGLIALRWKKNYGWPFVVTEHYGIYNQQAADRFGKRNYFFKYFTRRILKQADAFYPVSESLGRDVNEIAVRKAFTPIPNVVDTTLFFPEPVPEPLLPFRFVHVSDMTPNKNVGAILRAFRLLLKTGIQAELLLIGNDHPTYRKQAEKYGLLNKQVFLLGPMPYADVAQKVRQAHAGILYSQHETQSCVVLEWLCSGLPVIASAVGGVVELIHPSNGLLVEANQPEQLAGAMAQLKQQYHQYDRAGIAREAASRYSYEAVGRQLLREYEQVLAAPERLA